VVLWRIGNHLSLAGDGGLRASGRWHTPGQRIVYCAQSAAGALLEAVVHFEIAIEALPRRYRPLKLVAPDDLRVERLRPDALPRNWVERAEITRDIGDAWLQRGTTALLCVPSAIVPETFSVLVNPTHGGASRVAVVAATEHAVDPRLLK
jgi:RES domain-containing protein